VFNTKDKQIGVNLGLASPTRAKGMCSMEARCAQ
jgi:hypothetical protein